MTSSDTLKCTVSRGGIMEQKEKDNVTLVELKKLESTSEKLGREIRMLSRATKKLSHSGLKKETIVLLLHSYSNIGKPDVRAILLALERLEDVYCEKEVKPNSSHD
jgi:hypothetical protein